MRGLRRSIGLFVALSGLALPAWSGPADEVSDLYREGVDLVRKGRYEEALERFTRVLALQPSHEAAYELWKSTEQDILLDLLVKGGQYELVAKRFLDLARLSRNERRNDPDAISELLRKLDDPDVMVRKRTIRELGANHGEYAVPGMLHRLADTGNEERRVYFMHALTEMDSDVVLPLVAALDSPDAFLRRNVALVLGHIGDPRAAGKLTWLGTADADGAVKMAAKEGAVRCGSSGDALGLLLAAGDDYHHRRASVLRPHLYSDVVWSWRDDGLAATPVPRYLYADEVSKATYYDALRVDPSSLDARAGIARAHASQQATIEERVLGGLEVGVYGDQIAEASIAVRTLGVDALDRALEWSVSSNDLATGIALCRVLGEMSAEGTPGLWAAFQSGEGALAGEAAVALARIAYENDFAATPSVVQGLGKVVGTEVLRMGVVIDGDAQRGPAMARALAQRGILVHDWRSGARGLNLLRRVPGVDVILLADVLPDLTVDQVLDELKSDERTASVPVFLISADEERASELYGERVAGVLTSAAGMDAVEQALSEALDGDRARANQLAGRAASALLALARGAGRTDLSPALGGLVAALAGPPASQARPDEVVVPATRALGAAGTPAQIPALMAVLVDGSRSDDARVAAAQAVGDIAGRTGMNAAPDVFEAFAGLLGSDASLPVRSAAARAVGRLQLTVEQRAQLARSARVDVSE